ncbi:hypothetical protein BKA70DRAFT_1432708 [Coprinopsis sp. MPI-PUGE-AT-0042]|nr:hypothetical protein BKA70DRAFT_1432708 [Coprinopsis sp. MPI-PUGE-AT-0042]
MLSFLSFFARFLESIYHLWGSSADSLPNDIETGQTGYELSALSSLHTNLSLPAKQTAWGDPDLSHLSSDYFFGLGKFISRSHETALAAGTHSSIRWCFLIGASCSRVMFVPVRANEEHDVACLLNTLSASTFVDGPDPWAVCLTTGQSSHDFWMVMSRRTVSGLQKNALLATLVPSLDLEETGLLGSTGNILIIKVDHECQVLDISSMDWPVIANGLLAYFSEPSCV